MQTFAQEVKDSLNILELNGVSNLTDEELKKSYRKLSKKYHPDVCEAQYKDGVMFKKVNSSYEFLKSNLSDVNSYLVNPSKYEYQQAYNSSTANNNYQYQSQSGGYYDDLFRNIFRAQQRAQQQQRTYTQEELNERRKMLRKRSIIRSIVSLVILAFSIYLMYKIPSLGWILILLAIFFML